ncbi:hypothetical protein [Paenibacillus sp. Marseille-Q4541]|uniref:hypothetical protein n=1 Tax=Paenibacillus sp. Marseille-Q4541 TaxID=2831522 RepID=UPI001BAB7E8F|nr:hypothetical protein [Paenibacillus sp. Marseille-Q4541]
MNQKNKSQLMSIGLGIVLLFMLSGCGTTTENAQSSTASVPETSSSASTTASSSETQGTMLLGKVKSLDENTLTIYTSSMQPGQGEGMNGAEPPQGQPPAGSGAGTGTPPEQGQAPEGEVPAMPQDGTAPPDMDNLFTEETTEITITDTTNMPSSELQADDIVDITLEEGTQNALSVQVHEGFGGQEKSTTEESTTQTP